MNSNKQFIDELTKILNHQYEHLVAGFDGVLKIFVGQALRKANCCVVECDLIELAFTAVVNAREFHGLDAPELEAQLEAVMNAMMRRESND